MFERNKKTFEIVAARQEAVEMFGPRLNKNYTLRYLFFVLAVISTATVYSSDFVAILTPVVSSSVSGKPLSVTGISSQASAQVRVTINNTVVGVAITDILGNWSFTSNDINNGNYTATADLMDGSNLILASATNSFTIANAASIIINTPSDGDDLVNNNFYVSGIASLPSTTVNLSIDSTLAGTTTTDANGRWSLSVGLATGGAHTVLAELIVLAVPVATHTISVTATVPIVFPTGKKQMTVKAGLVPTTGSGSGPGYSYSNSGSITTITFTPAFTAAPIVVATGRRASGSSTITMSTVTASAVNLLFSTSTTHINFYAILFS